MFQINYAQKPNILDTYTFILTKFNEIKSIDSFNNFNKLQGKDLIYICNISFECLDKLSDVSSFIEKKLNDSNLNDTILENLTKVEDLNNLLHEQIYLFNNITYDVTLIVKDEIAQTLHHEVINYINLNLIIKYKQIIYKIINLIKKINIYVELLKPKLIC